MLHLSGHAHALLINFEQELTSQFGADQTLATRLRIPLFVGTFSPQGEQALRDFRKTLPADLQGFLTDFESGLDEGIVTDPKFEFRLRATVELAPRDPDAIAVQFTHFDDMTAAQREAVEEMGKKGQVVVRDRKQPVSGLGRLMPKPAAAEVEAGIPYIFNVNHFTAAWKRLKVRPAADSGNPHRTNPDFCEYDEPTKSYRYTRAYVKHLIKRCGSEAGFREATGMPARLKPATR